MFQKNKNSGVPSEAQAKEKLAYHVYEYLNCIGAPKAAQAFIKEAQVNWERAPPLEDAPGFLQVWWNIFYDLYIAAPERRESVELANQTKAFHDYNIQNSIHSNGFMGANNPRLRGVYPGPLQQVPPGGIPPGLSGRMILHVPQRLSGMYPGGPGPPPNSSSHQLFSTPPGIMGHPHHRMMQQSQGGPHLSEQGMMPMMNVYNGAHRMRTPPNQQGPPNHLIHLQSPLSCSNQRHPDMNYLLATSSEMRHMLNQSSPLATNCPLPQQIGNNNMMGPFAPQCSSASMPGNMPGNMPMAPVSSGHKSSPSPLHHNLSPQLITQQQQSINNKIPPQQPNCSLYSPTMSMCSNSAITMVASPSPGYMDSRNQGGGNTPQMMMIPGSPRAPPQFPAISMVGDNNNPPPSSLSQSVLHHHPHHHVDLYQGGGNNSSGGSTSVTPSTNNTTNGGGDNPVGLVSHHPHGGGGLMPPHFFDESNLPNIIDEQTSMKLESGNFDETTSAANFINAFHDMLPY